LEACGATLGEGWQRELAHHSYYHKSTSEAEPKGFAFAQYGKYGKYGKYGNGEFQVLVDGNRRVVIETNRVSEAYRLDGKKTELSKEEVNQIEETLKAAGSRTWPGWNDVDCTTDRNV
jgi:hypothetical protein